MEVNEVGEEVSRLLLYEFSWTPDGPRTMHMQSKRFAEKKAARGVLVSMGDACKLHSIQVP
jgi:hypothetical protein